MTYNDQAYEANLEKYGGKAGYSAEMRRRAAMRKTYGYFNHFGWLKENDPERLKQIIKERDEKRKNVSQEIHESQG